MQNIDIQEKNYDLLSLNCSYNSNKNNHVNWNGFVVNSQGNIYGVLNNNETDEEVYLKGNYNYKNALLFLMYEKEHMFLYISKYDPYDFCFYGQKFLIKDDNSLDFIDCVKIGSSIRFNLDGELTELLFSKINNYEYHYNNLNKKEIQNIPASLLIKIENLHLSFDKIYLISKKSFHNKKEDNLSRKRECRL